MPPSGRRGGKSEGKRMRNMTVRQRELLDFIRGCVEEHGFAPARPEIAAALGVAHVSTADWSHVTPRQEQRTLPPLAVTIGDPRRSQPKSRQVPAVQAIRRDETKGGGQRPLRWRSQAEGDRRWRF